MSAVAEGYYYDPTPGLRVHRAPARWVGGDARPAARTLAVALAPEERRRLAACLAGHPPARVVAGVLRDAAAGRLAPLPRTGRRPAWRPRAAVPARLVVPLADGARAAAAAAALGRPLAAWARDAVRAALGMRAVWSDCAKRLVERELYRAAGAALLAALPGRTASGVHSYAWQFLDVKAASRRANGVLLTPHEAGRAFGYDHLQCARAARAAGLAPRALLSARGTGRCAKRVLSRTEWLRALRAYDAARAGESARAAAERTGRAAESLRAWAAAEGHARAWQARLRLPSAAWDAIVARRAKRPARLGAVRAAVVAAVARRGAGGATYRDVRAELAAAGLTPGTVSSTLRQASRAGGPLRRAGARRGRASEGYRYWAAAPRKAG